MLLFHNILDRGRFLQNLLSKRFVCKVLYLYQISVCILQKKTNFTTKVGM